MIWREQFFAFRRESGRIEFFPEMLPTVSRHRAEIMLFIEHMRVVGI